MNREVQGMAEQSEKGVNRRHFIKVLGATSLAGVLASPLIPMLKGSRSSNDETEKQTATPAAKGVAGEKSETKTKHRSWTMVVDLRKCDGCVTINSSPQCTQSCIAGHFVPEGQQWIQVFERELPSGGTTFMPTPCFQCENAPCVNVCPVAATYQNSDGVVLIDHHRCIGCRLCMAACPYQRRFFNWRTPELPPEAAFAEYSPLYPVPAIKGTVIKCMFCDHMLMNGRLPFCVSGCPMKALYMGDLNEDVATNGAEVVQLSKFLAENDAFRYKEELGTQPRVWYLPGHGQDMGRKAADQRPLQPPVWSYGGQGNAETIPVWPWDKPDKWTWQVNPK